MPVVWLIVPPSGTVTQVFVDQVPNTWFAVLARLVTVPVDPVFVTTSGSA